LPQFEISSFPNTPHYGDDCLNLSCRQLLQQIEDDVKSIVKLIQRRRNQMSNIGWMPDINCQTLEWIFMFKNLFSKSNN